jgi:F0F1-type ATP synthase assembly protein I
MSESPLRDLGEMSGAGFTLVAYVLVFTLIGYGLDRLLGTGPWLMVVGVFVGGGLGFYTMIRTLTYSPPPEGGKDDEDTHDDQGATGSRGVKPR